MDSKSAIGLRGNIMLNFYARMHGPSLQKIEEARQLIAKRLGRPISNPMLFEYAIDRLLQAEDRVSLKELLSQMKGASSA